MKTPLSALNKRLQTISAIAATASLAIGAAVLASLPIQAQTPSNNSAASPKVTALPDGVYLYGQSTKPDELGKGYFVFEAKAGKVMGALYMPSSSFDCAQGTFNRDELALTVTNSYDGTPNPFEIALDRTSTVASTANSAETLVGLQGFYKLDKLSENDQRILAVCKADFEKENQ